VICHKLLADPTAINFLFMMPSKRICKLSLLRAMHGSCDAIIWLGRTKECPDEFKDPKNVPSIWIEFKYIA